MSPDLQPLGEPGLSLTAKHVRESARVHAMLHKADQRVRLAVKMKAHYGCW